MTNNEPILSVPPWPVPPPVPADGSCAVVEELASHLTVSEAFLRLQDRPKLLLLDSALEHPTLGRYSFLTADPFEWLLSRRGNVQVNGVSDSEPNPFVVLARQLALYRTQPIEHLPPFQGGAAGLFGYDLCHHIERLPRCRDDEFGMPDLAVGIYDWVIAFDHLEKRTWLISTGLPERDPRRRRRRAESRIRSVQHSLKHSDRPTRPRVETGAVTPKHLVASDRFPGLYSDFDRNRYLRVVERAIDYVNAGDCFQVNIAQRLLFPDRQLPAELYLRLRERNSATFAGYFDLGEFVVASASPERFLRVREGNVEARPIKGTRPRSANSLEDNRRIQELLQSGKDRAENIMIVDLLRNDLGRVCQYGSVRVPAVCRVESYRYVHHLVSEVVGRLRRDCTPVDLLRASFPGGSVTGAPKIRAMEIIAELEPVARGAYCGSLGYLGFDGSMDTSILIRTFTIGRGWVQFPVGGGIVADSTPAQEYEETWHKAEGMLRAIHA